MKKGIKPLADVHFLISIKDVSAIFAKWAIKQSPYIVPNGLSEKTVLFTKKFQEQFQDYIINNQFMNAWIENISLSKKELRSVVLNIISEYDFKEWNMPISGNVVDFKIIKHDYAKVDPDDDFIDLKSLAQNIADEIYETGIVKV